MLTEYISTFMLSIVVHHTSMKTNNAHKKKPNLFSFQMPVESTISNDFSRMLFFTQKYLNNIVCVKILIALFNCGLIKDG